MSAYDVLKDAYASSVSPDGSRTKTKASRLFSITPFCEFSKNIDMTLFYVNFETKITLTFNATFSELNLLLKNAKSLYLSCL